MYSYAFKLFQQKHGRNPDAPTLADIDRCRANNPNCHTTAMICDAAEMVHYMRIAEIQEDRVFQDLQLINGGGDDR